MTVVPLRGMKYLRSIRSREPNLDRRSSISASWPTRSLAAYVSGSLMYPRIWPLRRVTWMVNLRKRVGVLRERAKDRTLFSQESSNQRF